MPSERVQRQIDRLLDEAEQAMAGGEWETVQLRCRAVLALDPENTDAKSYQEAAARDLGQTSGRVPEQEPASPAPPPLPASFVEGRYQVLGLLGEGGAKRVFQAHDTRLDRDVAFALLMTERLDPGEHERVQREARALGRLSGHPNIVTVFEVGEEPGGAWAGDQGRASQSFPARPYLVIELMQGGDLAGLLAAAPDHRLALDRVLAIGSGIAQALAFAHGKGVIHRDLKPANVWLTQDGTPKLGDFGLALTAAAPRLTQASMVVGTALYLAPEQAMGQEVTPQADLYSLGCLLYELVTGHPPFVGDASVAVIGQHLHANPVAPSWSRPDCPKPLEALLLRLLEKDPANRPASADEVGQTLAAIHAAPPSTPSRPEPPITASAGPVYRRIFVGREAEIRQLEAAFDMASSGQGGLVLVVGEPGIGKTTLTEQLQTYASLRGGRSLLGHCYEEGSLSLPYLPFVEAMRSYVLDREAGQLKSELGSGAPEVARIVSEVRDRVQVSPAAPSADAGEDRYRLFSAVASFLRNAAAVQPLLLVLEDLHDADRGTLELLQFLARQLAGSRLLLLGTYRDVEVDRAHPLSAALAELRRGSSFSRVALRGLTADEVQRMLSGIAGQEVQPSLAEAVFRQTEGNPLFVQEVVRYLAEEGLIQREDGRWRAAAGVSLADTIPEGLRDVIGKRLARLSPSCNRVLACASVIGREFGFATLQAVVDLDEEVVLGALEEAVRVAVLQDQSQGRAARYRFTHAFFRQTLYEELIAPRRIRLHQQVAAALERQYAGRPAEHAAELSEHFAYASDGENLAKAVKYGRLAAERAQGVYAWSEAVAQLERCVGVQEVLDPEDAATLCDLLLAIAGVLVETQQELGRVGYELAPRAFSLAERLGDTDRAARVCAQAVVALNFTLGPMPANRDAGYREWLSRLERYAAPVSAERVYADRWQMLRHNAAGRLPQAMEHGRRALKVAQELQDERLEIVALLSLLTWPAAVGGYPDWFGFAHEAAARKWTLRTAALSVVLSASGMLFFMHGEPQRAAELYQRALEQLRVLRLPSLQQIQHLVGARNAHTEGRLEEAAEEGYGVLHEAAAAGTEGLGYEVFQHSTWRALVLLGRAEELLNLPHLLPAKRIACLAHLGRFDEVRSLLQTEPVARVALEGVREVSGVVVGELLEAATLAGEREAAAILSRQLAPLAGLASLYWPDLTPGRLLGEAALLLGERAQARDYLQQALEVTARVGFRPEVALTRLALAELLAGGDEADQQAAREHLAFVLPELAAMKMAPALAQAEALAPLLSPAADTAPVLDAAVAPDPGAGSQADGGSEVEPALPDGAKGGSGPPRPQVFISYASADREHALAIADALEGGGHSVWIDRRNIGGGAGWSTEIVRGIKGCGVFIVLGSASAFASPNVQRELNLAVEENRPLLPLLLASVQPPDEVRYALAGRQWVELQDRPQADWLPNVLRAIAQLTSAG